MTPQDAILAGLSLATIGYLVLLYLLIEIWLVLDRRGNTIGRILVETLILGKALIFTLVAVSLYKELAHLSTLPAGIRWLLLVGFTAFPWLTVARCLAWRRENKR